MRVTEIHTKFRNTLTINLSESSDDVGQNRRSEIIRIVKADYSFHITNPEKGYTSTMGFNIDDEFNQDLSELETKINEILI